MNQITEINKIPEWVNLCDGDWLEMKKLTADQLPCINEIKSAIKILTSNKKCSVAEATEFATELVLPVANSDTRMQSPRFGKIIVKLFMEYPPEIVDQAIDNLMFNLKWYPEPEVIQNELEKCCEPLKIAVSRAKTLEMLVRFNGKDDNRIGIKKANSSDIIEIQDRFARAGMNK